MADPRGGPFPGLLEHVAAHALDADYQAAAVRRSAGSAGTPPGGAGPADRARRRAASGLVLLLFGGLLATAAVQAARAEPDVVRSRDSLVAQIETARGRLDAARADVVRLRAQVERDRRDLLAASAAGRELTQSLDRLALVTGAAPATGPGVRVLVDDAAADAGGGGAPGVARQTVLDTDLQILVNGLWQAGAEAVAINSQRITALSAIRVAGETITVNFTPVSAPYVVTAVGDRDQLPARFLESDAGSWWLNLRSVYDLQFTMTSEESVTVPASSRLTLRYARARERQEDRR